MMDTYRILRLLTLVIIGILYLIKEGLSLSCYECHSKILPGCADFESFSIEQRKPFITKCWQKPGGLTKNFTMCRKIKQNVEGEKYTIRQCATYEPDSKTGCTKKTGTRKIKMEYCECDTDLCNVAPSTSMVSAEILCAMFIVYLTLR